MFIVRHTFRDNLFIEYYEHRLKYYEVNVVNIKLPKLAGQSQLSAFLKLYRFTISDFTANRRISHARICPLPLPSPRPSLRPIASPRYTNAYA